MSTTVTLNGVTYTYETDFIGSDGYAWTKPKSPASTGNVLFSLLNDFLSEVVTSKAGIASVSGVSPSSAGNVLLSDGANWVRSHSSGVTALLDALTVSGASSLQAVTATTVKAQIDGISSQQIFLYNDNTTAARYSELMFSRSNGDGPASVRGIALNLGVDNKSQLKFYTSGAAKAANLALTLDESQNGIFANAVTIASGLTVSAGGITVGSNIQLSNNDTWVGVGSANNFTFNNSLDRIEIVNAGAEKGRFIGGILAWGTTVVATASAGDVVLGSAASLRAVDFGGSSTIKMLSFEAAGPLVRVGQTSRPLGFPLGNNSTDFGGTNANLKGASFAPDDLAGTLVFYDGVTGARYKVVGTAF